MADILDAAQSNTKPSQSSTPLTDGPQKPPAPPQTEPVPVEPIEPPPIPSPPADEPLATRSDYLTIPPSEEPKLTGTSSPPPPPLSKEPKKETEEPPEKPKKKSRIGVLLAGLLLLVITLPVLVFFVRQQVEIRSRAVGGVYPPCGTGLICVNRIDAPRCLLGEITCTQPGGTTVLCCQPTACQSPNTCMSITQCDNAGGSAVSGYSCTTSGYVCCNRSCQSPNTCMSPHNCDNAGGSAVSGFSCTTTGDVCCNRTGATPTKTPTPIPTCQSPNTCMSITQCDNAGGSAVSGYSCTTSGYVCCKRPTATPTKTPTPIPTCQYSCNYTPSGCYNMGGTVYSSQTCSNGNPCCKPAPTPTPGSTCQYSCNYTPSGCYNMGGTVYSSQTCSNGNPCCKVAPTPTSGQFVKCCPKYDTAYSINTCTGASASGCDTNSNYCFKWNTNTCPSPTPTQTPYCIFDNNVSRCVGTQMCDVPIGEMGWLDASCHQGGANTPSCALPYYCTSVGTCIKNGECAPVGMSPTNCHADASCSGGGNTPTPPTAPQCIAMKVYKGGVLADLAALHPGDTLTFVLTPGGSATKARFRVNAGNWNETTTKNSSGQFTWNWTIPTGITSFTIEGEFFDGSNWY